MTFKCKYSDLVIIYISSYSYFNVTGWLTGRVTLIVEANVKGSALLLHVYLLFLSEGVNFWSDVRKQCFVVS